MKSPWIEGNLSHEEMKAIWEMEGEQASKRLLEERAADPFFRDHAVFEGPAPADLSERHDDYLYGDED